MIFKGFKGFKGDVDYLTDIRQPVPPHNKQGMGLLLLRVLVLSR